MAEALRLGLRMTLPLNGGDLPFGLTDNGAGGSFSGFHRHNKTALRGHLTPAEGRLEFTPRLPA